MIAYVKKRLNFVMAEFGSIFKFKKGRMLQKLDE